MAELLKEFRKTYLLTAAGCSAQKELPLSTLTYQIIETATLHANLLGIGYKELEKNSLGGVLSRLSFDIQRLPRMHETYYLTTWIHKFNKHFSTRNFEIKTESGELLGYSSTIWIAIDLITRKTGDLAIIENMSDFILNKDCPMIAESRVKQLKNVDIERNYQFCFTDIDFNRHVTTTIYVEIVENQLSLDFFDKYSIKRFDISFHHEALFGENVTVQSELSGDQVINTIIMTNLKNIICSNKIFFAPRKCMNLQK